MRSSCENYFSPTQSIKFSQNSHWPEPRRFQFDSGHRSFCWDFRNSATLKSPSNLTSNVTASGNGEDAGSLLRRRYCRSKWAKLKRRCDGRFRTAFAMLTAVVGRERSPIPKSLKLSRRPAARHETLIAPSMTGQDANWPMRQSDKRSASPFRRRVSTNFCDWWISNRSILKADASRLKKTSNCSSNKPQRSAKPTCKPPRACNNRAPTLLGCGRRADDSHNDGCDPYGRGLRPAH